MRVAGGRRRHHLTQPRSLRSARPQPIASRCLMHAHMKASTARIQGPGAFRGQRSAPDLASMLSDNVAGNGLPPLVVAAQRASCSGALSHAEHRSRREHLRATRKSCGGSEYRRCDGALTGRASSEDVDRWLAPQPHLHLALASERHAAMETSQAYRSSTLGKSLELEEE